MKKWLASLFSVVTLLLILPNFAYTLIETANLNGLIR